MFSGKYIGLESIMEKVYLHTGYNDEIPWGDVIEYVGEVYGLVAQNEVFIEKVTNGNCEIPCNNPKPITITNYRGDLPCDMYTIIACRDFTTGLPMRYTGDMFFKSYFADDSPDITGNWNAVATYKINDSHIFSSFKEGYVEMVYNAFPVDNNGLPLIPDQPAFVKAVLHYLIERLDYRLWRNGKISSEIYKKSDQDRDWYMGKAQTAIAAPSIDDLETVKRQIVRLIPKINEWKTSFRYAGEEEQRTLHNRGNGYY